MTSKTTLPIDAAEVRSEPGSSHQFRLNGALHRSASLFATLVCLGCA